MGAPNFFAVVRTPGSKLLRGAFRLRGVELKNTDRNANIALANAFGEIVLQVTATRREDSSLAGVFRQQIATEILRGPFLGQRFGFINGFALSGFEILNRGGNETLTAILEREEGRH